MTLSLLFSQDLFCDGFVSLNLCQSFAHKVKEQNRRIWIMQTRGDRRRYLRVVELSETSRESFPDGFQVGEQSGTAPRTFKKRANGNRTEEFLLK
jgi:hypothetical protein